MGGIEETQVRMPIRKANSRNFIQGNFNTIWPDHVEGFTRLIMQLRTHFGGDLDLMLVMAVIGGRTHAGNWVGELKTMDHLTRNDAQKPATAINLQSVSDYTGMPRETVRRKLAILLARGWITKNKKGHFTATSKAAKDLEGATGDSIEYLALLHAAFAQSAKNGDQRTQDIN